jgi:hypothetical protein
MAETRETTCSIGTLPLQEKLLTKGSSNVDEVVGKFNEDSTWADARFVAQVATVDGNRKSGPGLIELITRISETRGCPALSRKIAGASG